MQASIQQIVDQFQMQAHPEGGYFVETYRSEFNVQGKEKSIVTVIYFLLPSEACSSWHRIKSDEFWFFHGGSALTVHSIHDGIYTETQVGMNFQAGELPQHMVPAGAIFGASVQERDTYSLVSCMVAPGFDFQDFELFSQDEMNQLFPDLKMEIAKLY